MNIFREKYFSLKSVTKFTLVVRPTHKQMKSGYFWLDSFCIKRNTVMSYAYAGLPFHSPLLARIIFINMLTVFSDSVSIT